MTAQREWWTVEQIAGLVQANPETVRRWVRSGALKGSMIGGQKLGYRVARADLDAFLQLRMGKSLGESSEAA